MPQLTAEQAGSKVTAMFPSRTVYWETLHENFWYVCAIDKTDPDEGDLNPYFKVSALTGAVSEFYVVQNMALFQKLVAQAGASQ